MSKIRIWHIFDKEEFLSDLRSNPITGIFRYVLRIFKYSWQRITKGYCDRDGWSIDYWFLDIIPRMLEELRDNRNGSPVCDNSVSHELYLDNKEKEKDIHKQWSNILSRMIFLFREANEDTCLKVNKYQEEYDKAENEFTDKYGLFGEKLQTEEEKKRGNRYLHSMCDVEEFKDIVNKFFEEDKKIIKYRFDCKNKAFKQFAKRFYDLWD